MLYPSKIRKTRKLKRYNNDIFANRFLSIISALSRQEQQNLLIMRLLVYMDQTVRGGHFSISFVPTEYIVFHPLLFVLSFCMTNPRYLKLSDL